MNRLIHFHIAFLSNYTRWMPDMPYRLWTNYEQDQPILFGRQKLADMGDNLSGKVRAIQWE